MRVRGRPSLHPVGALRGDCRPIGNHRRGTNGWVGRQAVAGLATAIAPARR